MNNIAALEILMDCGYVKAGMLVALAAGCSSLVNWGMLRGVGLGSGWEGDVGLVQGVEDWARGLVGVG